MADESIYYICIKFLRELHLIVAFFFISEGIIWSNCLTALYFGVTREESAITKS